MNTTIKNNIDLKIKKLNKQLSNLTNQIESERLEACEEDSAILLELLDKKGFIERQILNLRKNVHDSESHDIGKEYSLDINGSSRDITIVHPTETNPTSGHISADSPLAKALLGKGKGDNVYVETPAGTQTYKIKRAG